jgi:hypothetical protein
MYRILADGIAWIDSDGRNAWPLAEAVSLAESLERMGYAVRVERAS